MMFKNIITVIVLLLHLAVTAWAQEPPKANKAELEAWQISIKDLTDRKNEIYAALKTANEVEEEKLDQELNAISDKKLQRKAAYIAAHPHSSFSLELLNDELLFMGKYENGSLLFSKLAKPSKQSDAGKKIEAKLAVLKRSAIGQQIPDFSQHNIDGKSVKFSDFKGKYVLIDFWASWCKPCRAENPNLLKAYEQYKDNGFTILGVSLDDKAESWRKAVVDDQMPWVQLSDLKGFKNEISSYYGVQAIPSTLLINPEGIIIAKDLRGKGLHRKLASLFNSYKIDQLMNDSISKMKRPERLQWIIDYISAKPESMYGPYFLSEFLKFDFQMSLEQKEALLNKFRAAALQSEHYISMSADLKRKKELLPGQMAPDFTLMQPNGKALSLSAIRGKYVLIDFWASWCVPCRKAIPQLKTLYAKYKSKGFEIISLSADQVDASWKKALAIEKMPWLQVVDEFPDKFSPSIVGRKYEVNFLPFYVLVDQKGKILVYSGNEKDVEDKLESLLN